MKTALLIIFWVASLLLSGGASYRAYKLYKNQDRTQRVLTPFQTYTGWMFVAVVLVFIPAYYTVYDFGDVHHYLRPLLLAIHNALRVFILDGDFNIIVDGVKNEPDWLSVCFSLHAALLHVIAPILTFSNVLVLFKNLRADIRYHKNRKKKQYVFSAINARSVALAQNICDTKKDGVIVFTGVSALEDGPESAFETQLTDMKAICLKKDVFHLDVVSVEQDVEIFLMSDDESENVSQAVKLTTQLNEKNQKQNVKVFVFCQSASGGYILDSLNYDKLLEQAAAKDYGETTFKLRRVNEKQRLVWRTVPDMQLFERAEKSQTISVLIAGMGSYGQEFFKTLLWYCQFEGYKLEINVIDKQEGMTNGKSRLQSKIERMCPDLLKTNCSQVDGDACYDIKLLPGVDMETADFADMLLYTGENAEQKTLAERLKRTNVAIVALGDDDLNIDVSVYLRSLFDRANKVKAHEKITPEAEAVGIYAVVYDEQKSGVLHNNEKTVCDVGCLRNHKNVPYNIHFIGGMSDQFSYENIYDAVSEKSASAHHTDWAKVEQCIHDEWEAADKTADLAAYDWSYMMDAQKKENWDKLRKTYEQYEYYRISSMAKELHRKHVQYSKLHKDKVYCEQNKQTCECEKCIRRKRSEHMRWNAYTRVVGYSYEDGIRADRARLHNNLCGWDKLNAMDKLKD